MQDRIQDLKKRRGDGMDESAPTEKGRRSTVREGRRERKERKKEKQPLWHAQLSGKAKFTAPFLLCRISVPSSPLGDNLCHRNLNQHCGVNSDSGTNIKGRHQVIRTPLPLAKGSDIPTNRGGYCPRAICTGSPFRRFISSISEE